MANQVELDSVYMQTAALHAKLSKAKRAQVGAVLVTNLGVTLTGFNGTPSGTNNECEYEINGELITKSEVIHAELNCILKAAKEGVSCIDSTVYVTLSPCLACAAMLKQAGIRRLLYRDEYRDKSGIHYLYNNGVQVQQYFEKE